MRVKHWLLIVLGVIAVTAFAGGPTPTPTPAASPTPTITPALPVLAGTPVPLPAEPISPDNVDRIRQLAMWGKGRIEHLAYSPDGQILAVGTTAGVWLYDAETLAELRFINTGNFVGSLTFTGDSTKLVVDSGASTVSIWDVTTAKRLSSRRIRDGYQGNINFSPGSVVFSPGGDILAATLDEQKIGLWANQGEKYLSTLIGNAYKLALSPDHKLLASGEGRVIQLWDLATGNQSHTLEGYEIRLTALAFSSQLSGDSSTKILLAASGVDGPIKLWDAYTGTLVKTLDVPNAATTLLFSPNDTLLAAGFFDPESSSTVIQVWRVLDGTLLHTLRGFKGLISSMAFSPDGKLFISGSWDGTVQRWNTNTGVSVDRLTGFGSEASASRSPSVPLPAFLSKDRIFIANPFNNQIELWDLKNGSSLKTLVGHKSSVTNLVLSTDGNKLVSAESSANTIQIWDPTTGQNLGSNRFYIETGQDKALAISPDGRLIASGEYPRGRSAGAVANSAQPDKWVYQLPGGNGSFNPAFSPDGEKIASFSGQATIAVSKAETGDLLHTLETEETGSGLVFSPDSQVLAVGSRDGKIQLWNSTTGALVTTLSSKTSNQIASLAFSPNGRLLAAGLQDTQLRLGALTPTIWLWDVKTGKLLTTFEGYQANIVQLAFSPDGGLLASASLDGTMRLWGIPPQ